MVRPTTNKSERKVTPNKSTDVLRDRRDPKVKKKTVAVGVDHIEISQHVKKKSERF